MRTFLAVRPSAEEVAHLAAHRPALPSAPERWHVTLVFLGEVDDPPALTEDLAPVCARSAPLELRLAGSGAFGRTGPVWVGVAGDLAQLGALATALVESCSGDGIEVERRPYRPHLTVGLRGRTDPRLLASYAGPVWSADEVELVESRLGRVAEHRVRARLPLGARQPP